MDLLTEKFFALLRCAIGTNEVPPKLTLTEFQSVFDMSQKQSLVAIMFDAISKYNCSPTDLAGHEDEFEELLMSWMGEKVKIERRNHKVSRNAIALSDKFASDGFESCLLKGQGNALMYPNPLLRTPGDIDIWIRPTKKEYRSTSHSLIRNVIHYVRETYSKAEASYHHIEYPVYNGTPVEVHYRPHFVFSFIYNHRLQKYFWEHANEQFQHIVEMEGGHIAIPTPEFNVVFQLSHIFNHLTHEGIGLRHILDYYFVLCTLWKNTVEKTNIGKTLDKLGLRKIAAAIMWILVNELGMPQNMAIVDIDEQRGQFVLQEILSGGNFGKFDKRSEVRYIDSPIKVQYRHIIRNMHMMKYFTSEAIIEPFARGVFFFQRKHLNRIK